MRTRITLFVLAAAIVAGALILWARGTPSNAPSAERHSLADTRPIEPSLAPATELGAATTAVDIAPVPAPRAERTAWTLTGEVYDARDRRSIAGATIDARIRDFHSDRLRHVTAQTDEAGRFALGLPALSPGCDASIVVRKPGYAPRAFRLERLDLHEVGSIPLVPGATVTGEIVDASGAPIREGFVRVHHELERANAMVYEVGYQTRFFGADDSHWEPRALDSAGRFELLVEASMCRLEVWGPGFAPSFTEPFLPALDQPRHLRIVAHPGSTLQGDVRTRDDTPVAGAIVEAVPRMEWRWAAVGLFRWSMDGCTTTGADGSFRIDGLPGALETVRVRREGFTETTLGFDGAPPPGEPLKVILEASPEGAALSPRATGSARVRVVDEAGAPVEGAVVFAPSHSARAAIEVESARSCAATDASGYALLDGVPLDSYTLEASHPRHSPAVGFVHLISSGEIIETEIQLGAAATLALSIRGANGEIIEVAGGRLVRDSFKPVPGAPPRKTIYRGAGEDPGDDVTGCRLQDREGRLAFTTVPLHAWHTLILWAEGHVSTAIEIPPLLPGESRDLGIITLASGGRLRVTITDSTGSPVVGACVAARAADDLVLDEPLHCEVQMTGPDGVADLLGLIDGSHDVALCAPEYRYVPDRSVEVPADGAPVEISYQLERHEFVAIEFRWADGRPAAEIEGRLVSSEGEWIAGLYSDADGRAEIDADFTGPVTLCVKLRRWSNGSTNPSSARLGHRPTEVEVQAASIRALPNRIELPLAGGIAIEVPGLVGIPAMLRATMLLEPLHPDGSRAEAPIEVPIELENGAWECDFVEPGLYSANLKLVGVGESSPQRALVLAGGRTSISFVPPAPLGALAFLVTTAENVPIAGAEIHICLYSNFPSWGFGPSSPLPECDEACLAHARTATTGTATGFAHASDDLTMFTRAAGFAVSLSAIPRTQSSPTNVHIVMHRSAAIEVALAHANGDPIIDGELECVSDGLYYKSDRSDADGMCVLRDLPPGRHEIVIEWKDQLIGELDVTLAAGEASRVTFTRPPGIPVSGQILACGEPVAGGTLQLKSSTAQPEISVDETGCFRLELASVGEYTWVWVHDGASFTGAPIRVDGTSELLLRCEAVRVEGRVVDRRGAPLADTHGALFGPNTRVEVKSNAAGDFVVPYFPRGRCSWELYVGGESYHGATQIAGPDPAHIVLSAYDTRPVEFVVTVPSTPCEVRIEGFASSARDGVPLVWEKVLAPKASIRVQWPAHFSQGVARAAGCADEPFDLVEGQREVRLEFAHGGELQVFVGFDGAAIPGCEAIIATVATDTEPSRIIRRVPTVGEWARANLRGGEYEVHLEGDGRRGRPTRIEIVPGEATRIRLDVQDAEPLER